MASIRLENVVKRYANGHVAVQPTSLAVADGEFLVLVGPSGCGKSTTLRMIAGLEEVTGGRIFIGDRCVNVLSPGKRDVAMVFQNYALYPHMTVRDNLSFGLRMRRTPKGDIQKRVGDAAEILSIESLLDRRPAELSGGQRQRVAVGRAIVRQPAAFLFDEPLSNLDARLRVQMRKELAQLHHRFRTTTVYVTHDQVEAMTLGERIAVMHEGVLQQVATPLELYDRPANRFVATFMGSPAMNLLGGRVVGKDTRTSHAVFQCGTIRYPLATTTEAVEPAASRTLGFRPEHLTLDDRHLPLAIVSVGVVEQLGSETLVYFQLEGQPCVARLDGQTAVRRGDRLSLHLPARRWFLFDDCEPFRLVARGKRGSEEEEK